jgi:hypothetical protein
MDRVGDWAGFLSGLLCCWEEGMKGTYTSMGQVLGLSLQNFCFFINNDKNCI